MAFRFSLVGDSNIKRHMSPLNCRDRPLMSGAQILPCGKLVTLAESLKAIRAESNVCILSCVTNFITSAKDVSSTVGVLVEPVLSECLELIRAAASERSDVTFLLCPPMYRTSPVWYRDAMPEILRKFSDVMKCKPSNLLLMPSFPTPNYEADGVHLTAYSGLEFVVHLFDCATDLMASLSLEQDKVNCKTSEATRVLEDRMVALEQDHRRLSREFESKSVVDAELACLQENIRFEDHFVIQGLPKIPDMSPREWQIRAMQDVTTALGHFLDQDLKPVYVQNVSGSGKDAVVTYQVRMSCVEHSKIIRGKFSGFFTGGKNTRPPALAKVSIRNRVSKATPVRKSLLMLMGERYIEAHPGTSFKVLGYDPRPLLKIFPAKDSEERVKTFNYVEAIKNLPVDFSPAELQPILERISPKLKGKIRQIFGVIDDDMVRQATRGRGRQAAKADVPAVARPPEEAEADSGEDASVSPPSSNSRKRGASGSLTSAAKSSKSSKSSKAGKSGQK